MLVCKVELLSWNEHLSSIHKTHSETGKLIDVRFVEGLLPNISRPL